MDKAYIVANKEQELNVLNKFEQQGLLWIDGEKPTEWVPSKTVFGLYTFNFPYAFSYRDDGKIIWFLIEEIEDETIVYDGRKEGKMDNKYKVTQEFMNQLEEWRNKWENDEISVNTYSYIPEIVAVEHWRFVYFNSYESHKRFGAIINWINGEDVFEVETPHKFVVRSEERDDDGDYWYVLCHESSMHTSFMLSKSTKFDTREEAQEWANSHQVVVEIGEEGNEVEE